MRTLATLSFADWIGFTASALAFGTALFTYLATRTAKPLVNGIVSSAELTGDALAQVTVTLREALKEQRKQVTALIKVLSNS